MPKEIRESEGDKGQKTRVQQSPLYYIILFANPGLPYIQLDPLALDRMLWSMCASHTKINGKEKIEMM
jgi:hypothetical protein